MELLFTILTFLCVLGLFGFVLFLHLEAKKSTDKIHRRIDSLFTMDTPTPNEASKVNDNIVDLDEQNTYNVPPDVKLDIEGGDSHVPPEFESK